MDKTTNMKAKMAILIAARKCKDEYIYFSPVIEKTRFIENNSIPTLCVDANLCVNYSPKFVLAQEDEILKSCILHEILHYIHGHHTRYTKNAHFKDVPHMVHNIAMDIEVNSYIDNLNNDARFINAKQFKLKEKKSYEYYLNELLKKQPPKSKGQSGGGKGKDKQKQNKGENQGDGNSLEDKLKKAMSGKVLGEDMDNTKEATEDQEEARNEIMKECEREQEIRSKKIGNSDGYDNVVRKLNTIKYAWDKILRNIISKTFEKVYGFNYLTYDKPNRRLSNLFEDIIFPSRYDIKHSLTINVIMDISGSMGDLIDKLYGMLKSIDINNHKIIFRILETNVEVVNVITDFDVNKTSIKSKDNGGTDMMAGIKYIMDNKLTSDLNIIMTDGETDWDKSTPLYNKTIVLQSENNSCPYKHFEISY
jgi:predicted metal-dependent peptidase